MKNKSMLYALCSMLLLAACAGTNDGQYVPIETPTVDYVENLDVYSAKHKDSFLNQLAMNYRSYAIYNARQSGYSEMGELFAQKAVAAFSGELPFPETLDNWPVEDERLGFELNNSYNELMDLLANDAADNNPELAAEAQAKFDCWLSATASGQTETADECHARFAKAISTLRDCDKPVVVAKKEKKKAPTQLKYFHPETRDMAAMPHISSPREGVIIVNNVNLPEYLINPVPVPVDEPELGDETVARDEFINMMMALRAELIEINERLDVIEGERTMIKVQQIPLEPKQRVMEEIFEVQFDFNKATIKPEYEELIRKLVAATRENNNIKVSVVGHTDTSGKVGYNYALGGRRAEAVQKMLIKYGIPSSQIVSVSAGEKDLKVKTPDATPKAENRRVQVIKETHYTEYPNPMPARKSCGGDRGCGH